jgi:hypothetical protein
VKRGTKNLRKRNSPPTVDWLCGLADYIGGTFGTTSSQGIPGYIFVMATFENVIIFKLQECFVKNYRETLLIGYVFISYGCYSINHLTPNGHFSGRTAPLTYRCCIFYLFNRYTY